MKSAPSALGGGFCLPYLQKAHQGDDTVDVSINQINPFTQSDEALEQIARVYQEAFGGPPWYEDWDIETIKNDFTNEMNRPGALCVIAQIKNQIVGFAWGYTASHNRELDDHLDGLDHCTRLTNDCFYLDECAVAPEHHGNRIGTRLIKKIFALQQCKKILLRTKCGSQMHRLITKMGGKIIQHIADGRVIMHVELS